MKGKKREKEMVKLQVLVERETAEKISQLADRMGASQSKMCQWLIEAGIEDNELVIRAVTSRFGRAVREIFGKIKGKRGSDPAAAR